MIGNIAQLWRLTRELDLNAIRADFERGAVVRILGTDQAVARRLASALVPEAVGEQLQVGLLGEASAVFPRGRMAEPDALVVVVDGPLGPSARRALTDLTIGEAPLVLVQVGAGREVVVVGVAEERVLALEDDTFGASAREALVGALVRLVPEAMLPLGRRHPPLREPVARHLVRDAARVNAQLAALSSVSATVPLVGGVVGDMADLLILTKNQVLLLFKLAGLYGRDLALGRELLTEVLPVVGGAFVWRTTARTLVGLLPTIVSIVPKTAVAYSGTYVVGEMARYYYRHGRRPPPELVRQFGADGARLARSLADRIRPGRRG